MFQYKSKHKQSLDVAVNSGFTLGIYQDMWWHKIEGYLCHKQDMVGSCEFYSVGNLA